MKPTNNRFMAKWPFFLADGVLVSAAGLALWFGSGPPSPAAVVAAVLLLLTGALVSLVPYGIEFYWSWQQIEAERREAWESQQQAMVQMGAEIKVWLSRCESVNGEAPATPAAAWGGAGQLEEIAQALGQWEARLEQREGQFAAEIEHHRQEEGARRKEFRHYLDQRLSQLADFFSSEEETEIAPAPDDRPPEPEPEPEPGWAAETMDPPAAARIKRRLSGPPTQVRDEGHSSLFATTTLVATAFIGPSHKLYLRGEGPGLSWSKGVLMNFVEIGKWSWTTTEASGPIRVQVLKNDEEQDRSGILVVDPGSTVSLRPDFD